MLRFVRPPSRRLLAFGGVTGLILGHGCLKSLDESMIRDQPARAGAGGTGATDAGGGRGGTGGEAGTAGSDGSGGIAGTAGIGGSSGTVGTAGTGGSAGQDAGPSFIPYSATKYPVTNLLSATAPVILAAEGQRVYRSTRDAEPANLVAFSITGSAGVQIYQNLHKPQASSTIAGSSFVFVAAGEAGTSTAGTVWRVTADPGDAGTVGQKVTTPAIELAVGIYAASDDFVYVTAKASAAGKPTVLRSEQAAGKNATSLYASEGSETAGDVTASADCVYWISNGNVWLLPVAGSTMRHSALMTPVTDAVGLTSDATNFYYTRSNGEVWQRQLSPSACDGSGAAEQRIAAGFTGIGDVIAWSSAVAWTAKNYTGTGADGAGVFTTPIGGGDITQIAPKEGEPEAIAQGADHVVYATATGRIRSVPKVAR